MSGFGADQGTGAAVVAVLRSPGGPGEATGRRVAPSTGHHSRGRVEGGVVVRLLRSTATVAWLEDRGAASVGVSQLVSEPAVGDLEAPHGRPTLSGVGRGGGTVFAFELGEIGAGRMDLLIQSAALRIGDGAGRVLRLDLVIDERIEQELFSHILEEVLLSPAIKHAVGDLNVAQVPSTRDNLRLMAVVRQSRDLP